MDLMNWIMLKPTGKKQLTKDVGHRTTKKKIFVMVSQLKKSLT